MKEKNVAKAIYTLASAPNEEAEKINGKTMRWSKAEIMVHKQISEITKELPEELKTRQEALISELLELSQQDGFTSGFRWGALMMLELLSDN